MQCKVTIEKNVLFSPPVISEQVRNLPQAEGEEEATTRTKTSTGPAEERDDHCDGAPPAAAASIAPASGAPVSTGTAPSSPPATRASSSLAPPSAATEAAAKTDGDALATEGGGKSVPRERKEQKVSGLLQEACEERGIPAILSFDEMSLQKAMEFDQKEERVYGPHANVQVGMIRGVFSQFKQPVFFEFDKEMDASTIINISKKLKNIGVNIVGIVSDMGPKNVKLWRELGVDREKPYFELPGGESVSVFADVPHLLKLLRNHFIDQGYILPSGTKFTKEDLLFLVEKDNSEFQICHKVKPIHFLCKGSQRQRVVLAAQLFSHSVASAVSLIFPEKNEIAHFIQLVNDCFDIFNSKVRGGIRELDCGFGVKREQQLKVLAEAKQTFINLRAIGKKTMLPWQKGDGH